MTFAVVGATSWGLTLAWLLSRNGTRADVVTRSVDEAARITARGGIERLPEFVLAGGINCVAPGTLADGYDGVIVAVPAHSVRATLDGLALDRETPVLSCAKGLEPGSLLRMTEVVASLGWRRIAALSGPNLAHEVVSGLPAAAVAASASERDALLWQDALSGPSFRVYRSNDVAGVELGGALKNVVAIAAGAASGLGFGANAMAAIMTRGLAEITRLGVAMGASASTFSGLAGVGDLAATSFSPLSRNHRLGLLLARGQMPAEALATIGEAVEGVATARSAVVLGTRLGVDTPIAEQVTAVLDGRASLREAVAALLTRSLKAEDG